MSDDKKTVVNVEHAWSEEYRQVLSDIAKDGNCPAPYCKDAADYHEHPVDDTAKHWRVTQNSFNYQTALLKFLIIHRTHISSLVEVSPEAWSELQAIIQELVAKYNIPAATMMMRFGDTSYTGGTVTHLHLHLIVGHPKSGGGEPIFGLVGYGPAPEKSGEE